jgi:8-oxo-dGTP pyrophosphatase MutT (NUDIX family)
MASTNVMGVTNPASDALGHWHVYGERVIYESPWVWLGQVDVEPPGGPRYWHHVVRLSTAAVIALLDDQERVLMLWRHRFVPDRWGWELPGGMVEDGEETGYRAGRVDPLVRFQPMPGTLDAEHHVFTGRDPRRVGEPTDLAEAARVEWVPLASIPALIAAGDISNAGSLVALPLLLRLTLVAQAAAVCWPQGRSST